MVTELEPGMLVGRYRLVEQIAQGGMGTVWVGRDERLDRDVAVKVLPWLLVSDPSAERRFEREARAMGRLQHANVVCVYDVGSSDPGTGEELPFLVMELIRGESLDRLVAKGPLASDRALRVFGQVADALESAHEAGVIHRDLKPSNIMLSGRDHVKVLDFGLARLVQQEGSTPEETLTTPGMVLGSCPYMAPEQALGQKVGPASDVFSCGAVMYEALTGRRAFDGSTPMRVLQAVVKCEFEPISELAPHVPPEIATVVNRCLAKDLEVRYSDGGELSRAVGAIPFREASGATAPVVRTEGPPMETGAALGGGLVRVAVTGLVAVLVGGVGGFLAGRAGRPPEPPPAGPVAAVAPPVAGRPTLHASVQPRAAADTLLRLVPGIDNAVVAVVGSAAGADGAGRQFPAWAARAVDDLTAAGVVGEELIRRVAARGLQGSSERLDLALTSVELDSGTAEVRLVSAGNPYLYAVSPAGEVDVLAPSEGRWNGPGWRPADHRLDLVPGAMVVVVAGVPASLSSMAVERLRDAVAGASSRGGGAISDAIVAAADRLEAGSGDRVGLVVVSH